MVKWVVILSRNVNQQEQDYMDNISDLDEKYIHYTTAGAKDYFRRVWIGYVILALSGIIGVWAVTDRLDRHVRNDINALGKASCLAQRKADSPINKFNDLVEQIIQNNRAARDYNLETGQNARARLNTQAIIQLQKDRIPVPTEKECNAAIIPVP